MSKVKLAMIRSDGADACPFGLSIPFACKYAGELVDNMAPIGSAKNDEDREKIKKSNNKLLTWRLMDSAEDPVPCKFSTKIFENQQSVECNYADVAPGIGTSALVGAEFHNQPQSPTSMNGLLTYPIGYNADYNTSRNLYYGLFSLQGGYAPELKKVAQSKIEVPEAAMVLFFCPEDQTVLLLKRAKGNHIGYWGLPGGHLKDNEFPALGAVRELREELGFVPLAKDLLSSGHIEFNGTGLCVIFIIAISKEAKDSWDDKIKLNAEHDEYKWFSTADIPDDLHPVAKFVLKDSANIVE